MNTGEYISSGILEAYVLGSLSAKERAGMGDAMVARHPEVKAELDAIQDAMNAYTMKHAVEPPAHLKDKILNEIALTPRPSSNGGENHKVYRMEPPKAEEKSESKFSVFAIAASVALLISIPLNIYLYTKVSSDESKMTAMNDSQQTLTKSLLDSTVHYQAIRNEVAMLNDPMYKVVRLNGLKVSPNAKATACWRPDTKELYFSPESLPAAPSGMEYQLWAIVDGKPVDAGMIKMDSGMQKMKLIANATAFAVTLEKAGGSPTPKGDMYVMGTI